MPTADGYLRYGQDHRFEHALGTLVAPSANRTGSARLLRVCGPYGTRIVSFDAARVGMPPQIPAAADTEGDTYAGSTVSLPLPVLNAQTGLWTFKAAGELLYLQNGPRVPGVDPFPTGGYPWSTSADYQAYVLARDLPGFGAALGDPNPSAALTVLCGDAIFNDDEGAAGWFLTSLPAQSFSSTLIAG